MGISNSLAGVTRFQQKIARVIEDCHGSGIARAFVENLNKFMHFAKQ
jgi:hypothetical protein